MEAGTNSNLYSEYRESWVPAWMKIREPAEFYDPIPISEKLVQAIWAEVLFDTRSLKTTCGKTLQILYPGDWNTEGGPDFRRAILLLDETEVSGDVEIHLHSDGWKNHQHHRDPGYNQVVLDVSLWESVSQEIPTTSNGKRIPQLVLQPRLQCSLLELTESIDPDRYPFSPTRTHFPFSLPVPPAESIRFIESAGIFRFENKAGRFQESLKTKDSKQAAYEGVAEALGYKHNKIAFRSLAQSLPLHSWRERDVDEKIDLIIQTSKNFRFRISQVRPANHPERRLAALALLLHNQPSLPDYFEHLISKPASIRNPPQLFHPYWSHHYHSMGKPLTKPVSLLGKGRWLEILTNVVLPFQHALDQSRKKAPCRNSAMDIYLDMKGDAPNLAVRKTAFELGIRPPTKVILQQGLLQIYQDMDLFMSNTPVTAKSA